ncbi:MAG: hypothetical protein JWP91_1703 [Fibrobacteres bacterium]|nr:hypothetical protein [Fibrobacterota bacterium]
MWYANDVDTAQISFADDPRFLVIVECDTLDPAKPDTVDVVLRTEQGDQEILKAIETGPASGRMVAAVSLKGIYTDPVSGNGLLEVDGTSMNGESLILDGSVDLGNGPESASMDLGFPGGDAIVPRAKIRHGRTARAGTDLHSVDGKRVPSGMRDRAHIATLASPR